MKSEHTWGLVELMVVINQQRENIIHSFFTRGFNMLIVGTKKFESPHNRK